MSDSLTSGGSRSPRREPPVSGTVSIWKLSRFLEGGRVLSRHNGFGGLSASLKQGLSYFAISLHHNFDKDLFNQLSERKTFPTVQQIEMIEIGVTSVTLKQTMVNKLTEKIVATVILKMVCVNIETRKAEPVPKVIRDKCRNSMGDGSIQNYEYPVCPLDAYYMDYKMIASFQDANGHVNQSNYTCLCMDCATNAALSGYYKYFVEDMCKYQVEEMDQLFLGESFRNDVLSVKTWQNPQDCCDIYFIILKLGKAIHKAKIRFHLQRQIKSSM